jgi:hypothetical protein
LWVLDFQTVLSVQSDLHRTNTCSKTISLMLGLLYNNRTRLMTRGMNPIHCDKHCPCLEHVYTMIRKWLSIDLVRSLSVDNIFAWLQNIHKRMCHHGLTRKLQIRMEERLLDNHPDIPRLKLHIDEDCRLLLVGFSWMAEHSLF